MTIQPMFSIITVCLNAGDNLSSTIDSILNQSFTDFELIIKDGMSVDCSLENLPSDPRVRIAREPDFGIFDAMNQALTLVRGNYVFFLNAGDLFFDRNTLAVVAAKIRENTGVDLFYGNIQKNTSRSGFEIYPRKLSRYFIYTNGICHQAWFASKSLYQRLGGFDSSHINAGDYIFLMRALLEEKAKAAPLRRVVAIYKGGGISSDPSLLHKSEAWRQAERDRLFTKYEVVVYSKIYRLRNSLKSLFYDKYLSQIWRLWYRLRFSMGERHSKTNC